MRFPTIRAALFAAILIAPFGAHAADLGRRALPPSPYLVQAPSYTNWTGFYGGLNAGYGFGTSSWDGFGNASPKGFLAGVTFGYNYQTGGYVWGLEGDLDFTGIKGNVTCGAGTCETKNSWFGTERVRLGYAGWNGWLPYITGGAAFGDVKATTPAGSASATKTGWTAGLGLEYAMWANWSVKAEYLYADLGSVSCSVCAASVGLKTNIVRGGVNYRF